ncbi:MAG: thioredoxin [Spirochaetales bacterium]|nr:thioredoxin [Spirochaetales bacterium]
MGSEIQVTKDNFKQEVLDSGLPVLVDFWAAWCMPCKMMEPILEKVAEDLNGKVKIAKVNVDEEQELASEHNIVSIPTLLVFKGGEVVDKKVGAVPRPIIDDLLKQYL